MERQRGYPDCNNILLAFFTAPLGWIYTGYPETSEGSPLSRRHPPAEQLPEIHRCVPSDSPRTHARHFWATCAHTDTHKQRVSVISDRPFPISLSVLPFLCAFIAPRQPLLSCKHISWPVPIEASAASAEAERMDGWMDR